MNRHVFALLASVLAAVVFVGLNMASQRFLAPVRLDFTGDRLYTLSPSALQVTGRLTEPVELELVYSRTVASNFPAVRAHGERVRELLAEIVARSNGKVRIRETDPAPFSTEEDRVTAAGITAAAANGGDPLYFGVLGKNTVDDVIAIPYLAPERDALLEYDLIRLVAQLDDPAPKKVAILSSLPSLNGSAGREGEAFVIKEMRRAFEVEYIDPEFRTLPKNIDVLLVAHPPELDEWQQYLLDQFLLRKGRALIALDPVSRIAIASGERRAPPSSHLGRLEESIGVRLGAEAVADRSLALPVAVDAGQGRRVNQGQPLFIAATPASMSKTDPVTADLTRPINFGAPGRLTSTLTAGDGRTFTPLVSTSSDASLIAFDVAAPNPPPRTVIDVYKPIGRPQVLAGRLSGKLATAFPNGAPSPRLPDDPVLADIAKQEIAAQPKAIAQSGIDAQIIFISDADVFEDGFYINPGNGVHVADNAAFILNALDNLAGDPALMALRSRQPALRPMEKVDAMRKAATDRLYAQQSDLEKQLADAENRLKQLEEARKAGALGQRLERPDHRSGEEQAEIERFRAQAADIRGRLRGVERSFRSDIDTLAGRLEFFNVWLPPLLVTAIGVAAALLRRRARGRVA
jgi:ABC-type uncharacterized transport system involved in gliding motility auxiliary subunit